MRGSSTCATSRTASLPKTTLAIAISLFLWVPPSASAQNPAIERRVERTWGQASSKPAVAFLGMFHFAGERVDADNTPADLHVNMLAPAKMVSRTSAKRYHPTFDRSMLGRVHYSMLCSHTLRNRTQCP